MAPTNLDDQPPTDLDEGEGEDQPLDQTTAEMVEIQKGDDRDSEQQ